MSVVALCFTASMAVSQSAENTATQSKSGAVMTFEKDVYEFGTIKQGEKVSYTFEFTNTGTEPLIIAQAFGSCGCTVPEWPKEPIAKGKKGQIHVTFNSEGKLNMQDKTVTINSNASNSPVVLHLKGNVVLPDAPKQ